MEKRVTVKSEREEYRLFRSRAYVAALIVFLALSLVFARLVFLQMNQFEHFTALSKENYQKRIPIPPVRGLIYDRNGVLLADNHIEYVLEAAQDDVKDMQDTLSRLMQLLPISLQEVNKYKQKLRVNSRFLPVVLRKNLTEKEIAIFSANRARFPGFKVSVRMQRNYPLGSLASHLIGYVGRVDKRDLKKMNATEMKNYTGTTHIGISGIEKQYENLLHGQSGMKQIERNVAGRVVDTKVITPSIPGQDIYLNIDIDLQMKAESLLGESRGVIALIDVNDGAVLTLVSTPSFDPNWFVNGISVERYDQLMSDSDLPLFDRSTKGLYHPGQLSSPWSLLQGLKKKILLLSIQPFAQVFINFQTTLASLMTGRELAMAELIRLRRLLNLATYFFMILLIRWVLIKYIIAFHTFSLDKKLASIFQES